ncbi:MAG: hypothetical protein ABSD13_20790 [Candidatus Korobacteraceae bacterium]|jgi:hypothetical protein
MKVRALHNDLNKLDPSLQNYAYGQGSSGIVDLTEGKEYTVYGTRDNKLGKFYFVLTDEINTKLPWWMPAGFFEVVNTKMPDSWKNHSWDGYGKETIKADPIYFDANLEFEDRTQKGFEIFDKMRKDAEEV